MEQVKRNLAILSKVKYLGLIFGVVMYMFVEPRMGSVWASVLCFLAGLSFILICENSRKIIMCEHVANDLGSALKARGFSRHSFEIKNLKAGLIIRIYLIRAEERVALCNSIIMEKITQSWYKDMVWITQLVDLNNEDEIKEARETLDDELIEEIKRLREESRRDK